MTNTKFETEIFDTIKSIMGVDFSQIDKSTPINTLDEWDSFNNLMLITEFQEKYAIEFTVTEVDKVQTLQDLIDLLKRKTARIIMP